jgi:hypothetical protein
LVYKRPKKQVKRHTCARLELATGLISQSSNSSICTDTMLSVGCGMIINEMINHSKNQEHIVQMECFGGPADGRIKRVNKKWIRYLVIEDEKYIPYKDRLILKKLLRTTFFN